MLRYVASACVLSILQLTAPSANAQSIVGQLGFSVGADLRMPTGPEEDLLGAGEAAGRALAIGSWEEWRLAVHINGGAGIGGVSREYFWSSGTTLAVTSQVTIVGEVMGRRLSELSLVRDIYQPHPLVPGVETMRWLPGDRGVHSTFFVTGAKWNVARSWLVNTNLLIRVTDAGLRARDAGRVDRLFVRAVWSGSSRTRAGYLGR